MLRILLAAAVIFLGFARAEAQPKAEGTAWVYVGTYTGKGAKGIYKMEMDLKTGKLGEPKLVAETTNPSFIAIHPNRKFMYATNEVAMADGKKTGTVSAFSIDEKSGELKLLNSQPSIGTIPCHLVIDKQGKYVLTANYGTGSAIVHPIGADGKLGEKTGFVQHEGKSVDKGRQQGPHAHSINLDASNKFAFVADLGLDKVLIYRFDADKGTLTANDPPAGIVAPGDGPRHFAFHPSGKYAYVINEMGNTVTAFAYDAAKGKLDKIQDAATLPKDAKGPSYTSEIVVHPSGKFLYGSNRGHDTLAIFTINDKTGELTPAGHQGHLIKWPRNFVIDPTGQWLLSGGERNGKVVVFAIDQNTGALTPNGSVAEITAPVCIRFLTK